MAAISHQREVDVIRGLSALAVVANHIRSAFFLPFAHDFGYFWAPFYALTNMGGLAVAIFFVLSGYLVGGGVLRKFSDKSWSWQDYVLRRYLRLAVVAYPAIAATLLINLWSLKHGVAVARGPFESCNLSLNDIVGNACFLQGLVPGVKTIGNNAAFWSLSLEFWYYIAFPLMFVACIPGDRSAKSRFAAGAILLPVLWVMGPTGCMLFIYWLMGAAVAKFRIDDNGMRRYVLRAFVVVTLLTPFGRKYVPTGLGEVLVCALLSLYLLLRPRDDAGSGQTMASKAAHKLSEISYSLYAVHMPLVICMGAFVFPGNLVPPSAQAFALFLALLAAAVASAWLFWRCFESNTDRLRRKVATWISSPRVS